MSEGRVSISTLTCLLGGLGITAVSTRGSAKGATATGANISHLADMQIHHP